ncbi:hypothetical protein TWF481_007954 [Arthrobotrys musiformis]|uniref:Uncharacterized protein n=1 Tax=Arthrobotrys musiformis TaxID=47236 RepID=A0AAV9W7V6_9PEZI
MAATLIRSLSIPSSFTFLLSLTLTWKPTYAQNSQNADDRLTIALWETTQTLSALGTLTAASDLPKDCFSLETTSTAGALGWFQGCDVVGRRSCCPGGYSAGGFYSATECPAGYTPRPTGLETVRGTPVAYTFSVDRTDGGVAFCCPTVIWLLANCSQDRDVHILDSNPDPRGGWQENGFFMSDGIMCDWISVDAQASTTLYQRGAASAIVIVSTPLASSSTSAGASTSRSTGESSPAETSASSAGGEGTSSGGGMSNGAIIGIAVGVGFPVLAILGFLIYKFGGGGGKKENPEESGGVGGMMY